MLTLYQRLKREKEIRFLNLIVRYAPFYLIPAILVEFLAVKIGAPHSNGRISALLVGHLLIFVKYRYLPAE